MQIGKANGIGAKTLPLCLSHLLSPLHMRLYYTEGQIALSLSTVWEPS